jgi:hypothetical protein
MGQYCSPKFRGDFRLTAHDNFQGFLGAENGAHPPTPRR